MKHTLSYIKLILTDLKLIFSHLWQEKTQIAVLEKSKKLQSTRLNCTKRPRPKSNIPTLPKNPQIDPNNWKASKVCKQTPTKPKKNSKTFEQTLQYWKMGLPIYQIEAYQRTPPKVKHTSITQKSPIWSSQLENIESLQRKPNKI